MREELHRTRRHGHRRVLHAVASHRSGDDGQQQSQRQRQSEAQVALKQAGRHLRGRAHPAIRRKAQRGQVTTHHQENLDHHACGVGQPVDQPRHQRCRVVGHRPIESQMMQHDQLSRDDLQEVDQRQPLGMRHAHPITDTACSQSAIRSVTDSRPTEKRTRVPGHAGRLRIALS